MKFEVHCSRTIELLGQPYKQVHIWLDEYSWISGAGWEGVKFDPHHRRYRHHMVGIEEVRKRWGDEAARAAMRHVLDDLCGANVNDLAKIPKDEQDYLRLYPKDRAA